jgi:hypothetical protein
MAEYRAPILCSCATRKSTVDIFYYWKDYDADRKAGRIGWFKSPRKKLGELRDRHPDWIWAFRQPKNRRGELQLLARLRWTDAPATKLPIEKGASVIYYDPRDSVLFSVNEGTRMAEVTSIIRTRFPNAFAANFRGDAALHPMEADLLAQLIPKVASYTEEPFSGFAVAKAD